MNQTNQSSGNCQPVLEGNTRPNHPQSTQESSRRPRPHQPAFPKILREPRKCATLVLTTAIRARGPAATRHYAIHEYRLPVLPISHNHAGRTAALPAQPCRIRPLSAFHKGPFFRTSQIVSDRLGSSRIVSDRLGSSQIVSDRLRSSRIVWDRPSAPPAIPAELPKCSPDSARQTGKKARQSASFRADTRQNSPANALRKKFLRD